MRARVARSDHSAGGRHRPVWSHRTGPYAQVIKDKSVDGAGPMGHWIATRSAPNHEHPKLRARVNGVVKRDVNTSQTHLNRPTISADVSMGLRLERRDTIATRTPPASS
jgi:2-keto-4-pentenoate hydratase/2-oxohepta-3-ene-1,7-dioic acid hydratase in catechol pathway